MKDDSDQTTQGVADAPAEGGKAPKKLDPMAIAKKILAEEDGLLAQVGPMIKRKTRTEKGWVDWSDVIHRKASLYSHTSPVTVLSIMAGFIRIPEATEYQSTPYSRWYSADTGTETERLVESHWEPYSLDQDSVPFCDGALNVRTGEFTPWDSAIFGPMVMMERERTVAPQDTERFREFLSSLETVMPSAEARRHFQKVCGLLLQPHTTQKFAIFSVGPTGSLKSTIATAVLCAPAGPGGFAIEPIDYLAQNRFSQAALINKWANLSDDAPPGHSRSRWVHWFKAYTGSSVMRAEFKFHQSRHVPTTAKLWICCNRMPIMAEPTDSIWPRLCVFNFERAGVVAKRFAEDTTDNGKLAVQYWSDEATRACMLKWMLQGLALVMKEGLRPPAQIKEWATIAMGQADPVRKFLLDTLRKTDDPVAFFPTRELALMMKEEGYDCTGHDLAGYMAELFKVEPSRELVAQGDTKIRVRGYMGIVKKEEK